MSSEFIGRVVRDGDTAHVADLFGDRRAPAPQGMRAGTIARVRGDRVTAIAGPAEAKARVYGLLERYELDPHQPVEALEEVRRICAAPGFDDGVVDLTHLPFVTIDNEDSRDLDQALFIERAGDGYAVWYALADAAYYVRPGTALHARSLERGASFYLPAGSVPMLPRALSEGVISLNPNVDRRAVVFEMVLDAAGEVLTTRLHRARVHSRAKLAYDTVQADLDARADELAREDYGPSLALLRTVGELRIALARQRDVVEYERREARVSIDPSDPCRFRVDTRVRNDVERWNEQISLLCNIEGARMLERCGRLTPELQSVFRVHLPPIGDRLAGLVEILDDLVRRHGLSETWRWPGPGKESLADYLDRLPHAAGTERLRRAIERQVRSANRASMFSAEPGPHHALGVDAYARFSSPMREVVGIFTHKEVLECLGFEEPRDREADVALQARIIEAANRSKKLQKRLDKEIQLMAMDELLAADLAQAPAERQWHLGTVMGLGRSRVYVALDAFALDFKVYFDDLERRHACQYTAELAAAVPVSASPTDAETADPAPTIRIGDEVGLRVVEWDEGRRRYVLEVEVIGA